jgi:hypothetical protein
MVDGDRRGTSAAKGWPSWDLVGRLVYKMAKGMIEKDVDTSYSLANWAREGYGTFGEAGGPRMGSS